MSRKYKFNEAMGAYFISFVTNPIDYKYSTARNYGNDNHTVLQIDIN